MKEKNHIVRNILPKLCSISFENLVNLPCYVFWKNKEGIYLGYNEYGALNLGYASSKEIAGKSDYELFPGEIAKFYRENDQEVIAEKKQLFVPEKGVLKNKFPVIFLSYKMPMYNKNKVVGVLGIAFTRHMTEAPCSINNLLATDLAQIYNVCSPETSSTCSALSEKERVCLQYLCRGLTLKMIAKQMNLSPKTIETYIMRAKIKMNCYSKAQLVLAFSKAYGG